MQMFVGFDSCSVIAIFPERSPARLALIVFLRGTSSDQLHALRDNVGRRVFYQKVNMVGCHNVIEHTKAKALLRLEDRMKILPPIHALRTIGTTGTERSGGTSGTGFSIRGAASLFP
jgi:hypothetical protein